MGEAGPDQELRSLAARITAVQGAALFPAMAQYLATLLRASDVLIGEAADELHARTLGVCVQGAVQPNYTFPLAGTPSEALLGSAAEEAGAGTDSTTPGYFGMALHDAEGRVIGFVCAHLDGAMDLSGQQQCLVEIVSVLLTTALQLLRAERARGELDGEVHRLRSELDSLVRTEISAAATGVHRAPVPGGASLDLDDTEATGLHHVQREHILRILNATRWVIEGNSGAALKLGMKPATLRHRMKKLGIARVRPQP
jgi:hypothetical protein